MRWSLPLLLLGCSESLDVEGLFTGAGARDRAEQLAREALQDRLDGVHRLEAVRIGTDAGGRAHVHFAQREYEVPVFGAMIGVHLSADGVATGFDDDLVRYLPPVEPPRLDAAEAIDAAASSFGFSSDATATLRFLRRPQRDHLVWEVVLPHLDGTHTTGLPHVMIDAHDGSVLDSWDDLQTAQATSPYHGAIDVPADLVDGTWTLRSDRAQTWDAAGSQPESRAISGADLHPVTSAEPVFADGVAATVQWSTERTLDVFLDRFGRNGLDDEGGPRDDGERFVSVVHYGEDYANAFWNGRMAVYGDGDGERHGALVPLDIVAHELTHGVVDYTADLFYFGQSGALNESFADVFAALVEQDVLGPDHMWEMAETSFTPEEPGDAMRYLDDPTRDGSSRNHFTELYTGPFDNRGVHTNSGIPNLVFYLVAEGGAHPTPWLTRRGVQGIGTDSAGAIWYQALAHHLNWLDDFEDAREATLTAARELYGEGSFEEEAVANAWAEVGVGEPFGGPMDPAELPPQPELLASFPELSIPDPHVRITHTLEVPPNTRALIVTTSGGTGDADLYVNHGEEIPRWQTPDCRSWDFGSTERCQIDDPAAGTWFLTLGSFYTAFEGVTLEAYAVASTN